MLHVRRSCQNRKTWVKAFANIALTVVMGTFGLLSAQPATAQTFAASCTTPSTTPLGTSGSLTDPPSITTYAYPSNYAATQYPIVLLTGFLGSPNGGEENSQYWYQIPQTLSYYGATVCVPNLSGADSDEGSQGRGQELITYLQGLRTALGNPTLKFNLIGHSQGGLTARVAAFEAPDMVASVTTIGTPHKGSPLSDVLADPSPLNSVLLPLGTTIATLSNQVLSSGLFSALYPGQTLDPIGMLGEFTSNGIAQFNAQYPSAGVGNYLACTSGATQETIGGYVHYLYSWAGNAEQNSGLLNLLGIPVVQDTSISGLEDPALVNDYTTSATEISGQVIMTITAAGLTNGPPANTPDDGVVDECSAKYGDFLGAYPFNHLDEVNREIGVLGAHAATADPVNLLLQHANRLQEQGL